MSSRSQALGKYPPSDLRSVSRAHQRLRLPLPGGEGTRLCSFLPSAPDSKTLQPQGSPIPSIVINPALMDGPHRVHWSLTVSRTVPTVYIPRRPRVVQIFANHPARYVHFFTKLGPQLFFLFGSSMQRIRRAATRD